MEKNMENEMNIWFMRLLRLRFTWGESVRLSKTEVSRSSHDPPGRVLGLGISGSRPLRAFKLLRGGLQNAEKLFRQCKVQDLGVLKPSSAPKP